MEHNIYWQMYCDIWKYHQKYINNLQDSNEFWDSLVSEGKALSRKYNQNRFIVALVVNEIHEIENVHKEQQKKGKN